jgi:hypothetical protein
MAHNQTTSDLLNKLISHWCSWDHHETFYLETLAPQLVEKPESGDEVEREVLKALREILNNDEWISLPSLIREQRKGKLREIEQEKLRREAERKARETELERARQEQIEEERKRREKELALAEIMECLKSKFLRSDNFYKNK